jgi:hypothetical protein
MEGENAKTGRDSHHSRPSQHRASYESQMRRPEQAIDNQHLLSKAHADPRASGDFRNSASHNLNATVAEEWQGRTKSRKPPRMAMLVDTDAAQQRPERTSLRPTAECSDPLHLESSTGSSTPNCDRVLGLIETLRSKVESFVTGSFDLHSEVDRSHARTRIYRPVIDLVQDKEANRDPKACMCPTRTQSTSRSWTNVENKQTRRLQRK